MVIEILARPRHLIKLLRFPGQPGEQQQSLHPSHQQRRLVGCQCVCQRHERDAGVNGEHKKHGSYEVVGNGLAAISAAGSFEDAAAC